MQLETILLTNAATQRLMIARYIYTADHSLSLNELATHLNRSRKQVYEYVHTIQHELSLMQQRPVILLQHSGLIDRRQLPLGAYQRFLFKQSLALQLVLATLTHPTWREQDFIDAHRISRATLHRRVSSLRQFLKPYAITLEYQPLRLRGTEATIRLLYAQLLWPLVMDYQHLLPELDPRLDQLMQQPELTAYLPNTTFLPRVRLAIQIAILRQQQHADISLSQVSGFTLPETPPTIRASFSLTEQDWAFIYLQEWMPPHFHDDQDSELITLIASQARQNTLSWQFVSYLDEALNRHFLLPVRALTQDHVLLANLLTVSITALMFNQPFPQLEALDYLIDPMNAYHRSLAEHLTQTLNELPPGLDEFGAVRDQLLPVLYQLILPKVTAVSRSDTLKIAFDPRLSQLAINRLTQNLQHVRYLQIVSIDQQPDLVVSSEYNHQLAPYSASVPEYAFEAAEFEGWAELHRHLYTLSLEKRTQKL
ncbi:helix-turn-helix domain-containing protein [Lacticaseibacillus saniviri]|nr:helix-turn-helix domain-containing protein [Lacticaseibacillus saniviri]